MGPAGERVTRNSILATQVVTPLSEGAGEVQSVLNHTLAGPLDSGALYGRVGGGIGIR